MHTAPATSASSANVLSPGPLSPAPGSGGSPSKFQDVYQHLRSGQDQNQSEGQPAASSSNPTSKKKPSDVNATGATATTTATVAKVIHPFILTPSFPASAQGADESQASSQPTAETQESAQSSTAGVRVGTNLLAASTQDGSTPVLFAKQNAGSSTRSTTTENTPAPPTVGVTTLSPLSNSMHPEAKTPDTPLTRVTSAPQVATHGSLTQTVPIPPNALRLIPTTAEQSIGDEVPTDVSRQLATNESIRPANDTEAGGMSQDSQASSTPLQPEGLTSAIADRSLALNADNLAFSLELAKTANNWESPTLPFTEQPSILASSTATFDASVPKPTLNGTASPATARQFTMAEITSLPSPPTSQSATAGTETRISNSPSATPSRGLPDISAAPSNSKNSNSSDSTPRQPQNFERPDPSQRDSSNYTKSETDVRSQSASTEPSPAGPLNDSPASAHTVAPDNSTWSGPVQIEVHPVAGFSDPPAPVRATVTQPVQEVQTLVSDAPKTSPSSEILLHLDNGQTSAAVRVVDRAGTVNVSVHASDQDLRNSLRSNLSDLATQLNTQGSKSESLKPASPQNSSENRPDQGAQEQRSANQQHSSSQGDRQSGRERRNSNRWLEELQAQTSADFANSGGKNS